MDTTGGKGRGGGGSGVMNWEIGIDIYTVICIKWITNKNLFCKKNKTKFLKKKTSNKMAISTCLSIITLNVKGLNLQSKDIRWRRGLKNKKEIIILGTDVEKLELSCVAAGNIKWYTTVENSWWFLKTLNIELIWSSNSTPRYNQKN